MNDTQELPQEQEQEGITLSIETPDDIGPQQKQSALDIAKGLVRGLVHSSDTEEEAAQAAPRSTRKRGRGKGSVASKFFQKKSALICSGVIWLIVTLAPSSGEPFEINGDIHRLAPSDKQTEDMILPLLRIMDRHFAIGELSPDVSDIGDSISACIAYGFELKATMMMLDALKEHERKQNEYAKNQTPFFGGAPESASF